MARMSRLRAVSLLLLRTLFLIIFCLALVPATILSLPVICITWCVSAYKAARRKRGDE